jgi:hypothetical protein
MEANQIIIGCWVIIFSFSLYAIGRIAYQFKSIPYDYLINETINWDGKLNPYKIIIYLFFIPIFLFPVYLYKTSVMSTINKDGQHQILTSLREQIPLLVIAIFVVIASYWFLEFKIKSETKSFIKNLEKPTSFVKVFNQLKPSLLNADEIKKQFDYALKQNYFVCEFSQFENLLKLNEPIEKIIWKPISGRKKMKQRQLLLTFLNDIFSKKIQTLETKEACQFVNKYFEFNEVGHQINENPYQSDNFRDWLKTA